MAYYQPQFWDFARSYENNNNHGEGVDHPVPEAFNFFGPPGPPGPPPHGFPFNGEHPFGPRGFGPWSHGGHGHRGRHWHGRRGDCPAREPESGEEGAAAAAAEQTDGDGVPREGSPHHGPRGPRHGPGFHRGGRGGHGHGHGHGHRGGWGGRGRHGGFGMGGFDMSGLMNGLASHPLAQVFRQYTDGQGQRSGETDADEENTFTPPADVFTTETAYVLHIALPGAKKEDVGVNWDAEKGVLNIAGVVYRHGDEEFLKTLSTSERKVGVFERAIKLPPVGVEEEKEEVNSEGITAKLEDGVLVVTVPKVEREWTEVKRVDIE